MNFVTQIWVKDVPAMYVLSIINKASMSLKLEV
jgi:hypothetical protein